jgi:hypothetical protein
LQTPNLKFPRYVTLIRDAELDKNGFMAGSAESCENSRRTGQLHHHAAKHLIPLGGACANREASKY